MAGLDWLVIAIYFLIMATIVLWSSKKQNTSADYFLAGRNIGWFAIGGSLFASNIGSEHIVGLAGSGAVSGMAMAHWEMHAWIMLMLGWIFVPFYYKANVFTMPEFLEKRFNKYVRWILSVVSLIAYVFTKVSVTVYAGALVFQTILPDININLFGYIWGPFWIGAFITVIVTGVYTILGGFRAVLYTDSIQALLLIIGSLSITLIGLDALGGWHELVTIASERSNELALWRPLIIEDSDLPWWKNNDFPWLGIMIASPIIGIWYWCTDQYIVQRTLAAKNLTMARRGAIWGSFLKVWPVLIFLLPGIIGWALHQQQIISIPTKSGSIDGSLNIDGDQVFASMVIQLLPVGLRGLVVGGLLAALMSSLSSLFNSCATLFTVDGRQMNMRMAFLTQRMFVNNEHFRQISQNSDYFCIFKNPRNSSEIRTLAQQLTPGSLDLIEIYKEATKNPFSYLLINLTQECDPSVKYLSHIFDENHSLKVYQLQ